jgi:hypothetical protein
MIRKTARPLADTKLSVANDGSADALSNRQFTEIEMTSSDAVGDG